MDLSVRPAVLDVDPARTSLFAPAIVNAVASSWPAFIAAAESHALVGGLRKKSQFAAVQGTAHFLIGAGADLYYFLSARNDGFFDDRR